MRKNREKEVALVFIFIRPFSDTREKEEKGERERKRKVIELGFFFVN